MGNTCLTILLVIEYALMTRPRNSAVLPSRAEAISTITQFTELDTATITDHVKLAKALGGMSAALSAVALDYGETHRLPDIESNIGLWVELGEGADRHQFTVISQDRYGGLGGASIERCAADGDTGKYYRHVNVPSEEILRQFLAADPATLRQGYRSGRPSEEDIYAVAVTTDRGVQTSQEHWPFHMPVSRPDAYPTTPAEDATSYAQILQELSKTLLEVVR